MRIKACTRNLISPLAARAGLHTLPFAYGRLLVLMYHRVLPISDPRSALEEPGMWVSPESLDMQIRTLKNYFEIISLKEWLKASSAQSQLPARACALTFDDGWRDNYEFAYPLLKQHDVPATIFLVSDMIGTNSAFWPNRLRNVLEGCKGYSAEKLGRWLNPASVSVLQNICDGSVDNETFSQLVNDWKFLSDDEVMQKLDSLENELGTEQSERVLLDWGEVQEMAESGLIEFGSHTRHHVRLRTDVPELVVQEEVTGSATQIAEMTGRKPTLFCYPNGDLSEYATNAVGSNYMGAVTTQFGWNNSSTSPHSLKRIGLHEDISSTESRFLARISGWWP